MLLSELLTEEALAFNCCGQTGVWVLFAGVDHPCPCCCPAAWAEVRTPGAG